MNLIETKHPQQPDEAPLQGEAQLAERSTDE
jgi:hypothetical protein